MRLEGLQTPLDVVELRGYIFTEKKARIRECGRGY